MLDRVGDWRAYLATDDHPEAVETLRSRSSTGRPAGSRAFVTALERLTGRSLRRRKRGPQPRQ
jgi:putative transposase